MYRFGLMVKQQDYQIGKKMLFSSEIGILSEKDYQIGKKNAVFLRNRYSFWERLPNWYSLGKTISKREK